MASFEYSYRREVTKKDENGKVILKKREIKKDDGTVEFVPIPGQFETEEKWFTDFFNIGEYIRTYTHDDGSLTVLLKDGHEETQKTPQIKKMGTKGKPPEIVYEKERVWLQSQIIIEKPEEVESFKNILRGK